MIKYGVTAILWVGANVLALHGIEVFESRQLEQQFKIPAAVVRRYEFRTLTIPKDDSEIPVTLCYRYRPPSTWARRSVPLVVFLHGAGERGNDNVRQLRSVPCVFCERGMAVNYPCAVLAPQCPDGMHWSSGLDARNDLLDGVVRMIGDVLKDSRIDPDRVYLTGLSMGGFGTWELALRHSGRFAAVVPICGGGDVSRAARLIEVPVWAVHGESDEVVSVEQSRTMIAAIREAGGEPRYLELDGIGHNCWDFAFHRNGTEVVEWMFRQSRQSSLNSVARTSDNLPGRQTPVGLR